MPTTNELTAAQRDDLREAALPEFTEACEAVGLDDNVAGGDRAVERTKAGKTPKAVALKTALEKVARAAETEGAQTHIASEIDGRIDSVCLDDRGVIRFAISVAAGTAHDTVTVSAETTGVDCRVAAGDRAG